MEDGSSVRTKVAQYFVNKKLQELDSKDLQIKIDDRIFQQALPQFDALKYDERKHAELNLKHDESPQLPPFFPSPQPDYVSWKDLLKLDSVRREQSFPPKEPSFPPKEPSFPPKEPSFPPKEPNFPPKEPNFPPKKPGPPEQLIYPPWYYVAIIGAGVAGLRTAKLLQDMGIPYKIFEASDRPGGRIFTYQFAPKDPQGKHDYYDVGAMRFPDNDANKKTFELFKELGLSSKMIKYVMSLDDNIRYYNNIKTTAVVASTAGDHFNDEIVPKEYLNKEHVDLRGKKVFGVNACIDAAYDPFRKALIDNFDQGWEELMKHDWASTRSYLTREKPNYPLPVVHWLETRSSGTGGFDRAFSEAILDSLEFNDPTKDVQWWCLEGGSKVLIDAMLKQLNIKPYYGHRVTSVKQVHLPPHDCFLNLPPWPRWPRFPFMEVSVEGKPVEHFTHVVSTVSFANLGTIDTDQVPMTYKQRQAIRTLNYGPAVKVGIKFKTRWWEQDGMKQRGGSSYTDRQSRVVVYPSYGLGEEGPGILMVVYNWHQDASRFGALIQNPDWSKQLDPDRKPPQSEQVLLEQIYKDLATLHGVSVKWLREQTLDYHAFNWYQNPYTMGAFAHFAPGQFSTFFADIVQPAAYDRFHFAGEVASAHHAWVAGALDSAVRVVDEIIWWDFPILLPEFKTKYGESSVFSDEKSVEKQFVSGLFSKELEEAEIKHMYN